MADKRQVSRNKSYLRGLVYFSNSLSAVTCLVRDLSEVGARLKFSGSVAATDTLELHIPVRDETFHAKVIWRERDEVGITLLADAAVADAAKNDELCMRVKRLEDEIAVLRRLINRMQKNSNMADVA